MDEERAVCCTRRGDDEGIGWGSRFVSDFLTSFRDCFARIHPSPHCTRAARKTRLSSFFKMSTGKRQKLSNDF